jgi:hypothetical protein
LIDRNATYVDEKWMPGAAETIDVENPATEEVIGTVRGLSSIRTASHVKEPGGRLLS